MRTRLALIGALVALTASTAVSPTATAHPVGYVAGSYVTVDAVPNGFGQSTIQIVDTVFVPAAGDYCQDNTGDLLCGGPGDFFGDFCDTITLTSGVDWDPAVPLMVRVHPVDLTTCGGPTGGFTGLITHTP